MAAQRVVHRYIIPVENVDHELEIGRILHVAHKVDDVDNIHVWAEAENERLRVFHTYATEQEIPSDAQYIGTVVHNNNFVWHLYERFLID